MRAQGEFDDVLGMSSAYPRPALQRGEILVRIQACSLSPADVYFVRGDVDAILRPTSLPCVPGKDVCGVVEALAPDVEVKGRFKVGDRVAGGKEAIATDGLAEYAAVEAKTAVHVPESMSAAAAASLRTSPMTAYKAVKAAGVKHGDRVLVLGGSGGVGSCLVQLAKHAGASFVATTSTNADLLRSLGADDVIDYRSKNWWEVPEYIAEPFDFVFDTVGLDMKRNAGHVLKSGWRGGKFLALVLMNAERPQLHSIGSVMAMFVPAVARQLATFFWRAVPRFIIIVDMGASNKEREALVELVSSGQLNIVLDPASPMPFTEEGVKSAFKLVASRHARGKVVVEM
eukprot:CAMPEP_0170570920 /NCGR_PEP_ID=MMETSP0224-20130122/1381_1 /TAXON_ID=285029 /ORGANISM="Togula jolla, Strain CCCM 725" /LENGTH=342 /DNA_ID=CAMNT_0010893257 /DNA_START=68 /DNA_END=1096 /DNA_ORIENTATION=-